MSIQKDLGTILNFFPFGKEPTSDELRGIRKRFREYSARKLHKIRLGLEKSPKDHKTFADTISTLNAINQ